MELEDVFREVIVISDNEGGDNGSDTDVSRGERDSSVEVVSSNTLVGELQTRPVNYGSRASVDRHSVHEQSEDEAPPGFRFVPEPARKPRPHKQKVDRRGFNRYQAWNRAIDRYKETAHLPAQPHPTYPSESTQPSSRLVERPMKGPGETEDSHMRGHSGYDHSASARQPHPFSPQQANSNATSALGGENQQDINVRRFMSSMKQSSYIFTKFPCSMQLLVLTITDSFNFQARRDPPDVIRLTDGTVFERADRRQIPERDRVPSGRMEQPIRQPPRANQPIHSQQVKYPIPRDTPQSVARQSMIGQDQRPRVLPSIEAPTSVGHIESGRLDHDPSSARKRDINGMSSDQPQYREDPAENISGKAHPIVVDDDRQRASQKKNQLEHGRLPYGDSHVGGYGAYPPVTDTHLGQGQDQGHIRHPPGPHRQGPINGRPVSPAAIDKTSPTYRQYPEDSVLRVMRKPVADVQPVQGVPHMSQFADDFGERGRSNHMPDSPRVFYRSDGPGYTSTMDKPAMRSRPISHLVHSQQQQQQQHDRFGGSEARRAQGRMANDRLPSVRPVTPERQQYPSQNTRDNIYAPEFVRPVRWQDPKEPLRYEPDISSSREEKTVPVRHIAKYPPDGSYGVGEDNRFLPPGSRLLQPSLPPGPRPNIQDPYFGSRDSGNLPFHPEQRSNANTLPHGPRTPDMYDSCVELPDSGRYA